MDRDGCTNTSAEIPNDCQAFIVGPNHFQNTLFATYIETHSLCRSSVVDNIAPVAANSGGVPMCTTAVLYDCFELNRVALEDKVLAELERLPPEWSLILFNLDRRMGIEKKALEYGVHGFFYQDDSVETLLKGLAAVFGGELWVSRRKMADVILENGFSLRRKQVTDHVYPHDLTRREVEILGLLTLGASNEVIADKLFISPHTVRTHLNHIFRKIKVTSRLAASIWAAATVFHHRHN
jgi:LuxR family transcriptional regulator, positive regulator of biofilm formation